LHPVLVLVLGILGFVGKGAAPLVEQLGVEMAGGFFSFLLSWFYGPTAASWSPDVVSLGDWLVSSIWLLLFTGQISIGPEVTHCQLVQDAQSCCYFQQVAAALLHSCKSVCLAPTPARSGNSV
jgi:hypothetical protein